MPENTYDPNASHNVFFTCLKIADGGSDNENEVEVATQRILKIIQENSKKDKPDPTIQGVGNVWLMGMQSKMKDIEIKMKDIEILRLKSFISQLKEKLNNCDLVE